MNRLADIKARQARYAGIFTGGFEPECLSDAGHLGLVDVPWLVTQLEQHGYQDGDEGQAQGEPGAHGIGLAQAPVQLVHPQQAMANTARVVPTGNPLAKFFIGFLAKVMGVRFHAVIPSNSKPEGQPA